MGLRHAIHARAGPEPVPDHRVVAVMTASAPTSVRHRGSAVLYLSRPVSVVMQRTAIRDMRVEHRPTGDGAGTQWPLVR